jgi:glycosyltransferase involved in cell wall biosynthesis
MNNTITVVTPSFNQGQYIEQTIQSVLSQEGDFYIDYIIADGGSTDNTVEIIKKYDGLLKNNQYPIKCQGVNFRWWSRPDKGQSNAINQGFKIAKGDILAWINSDDYYEPGAFSIIAKEYKSNSDADLIYGDGNAVNEKGEFIKKVISKEGGYETFLKRGWTIFQPAAFFSKKIINKIGGLDESLHYAMDYDLWLKILRQGQAIHIPEVLANFREWNESKTSSDQQKFLAERQKIFKRHGMDNKVDPKKYYNMIIKIPGFNFLKEKMPFVYNFFKRIFHYFVDKINVKKKDL